MKSSALSLLFIFLAFMGLTSGVFAKEKNFFSFEFETIEGERVPLSNYKAPLILVVNTASRCGYTRQYADLQALHEKYRKSGLIVLGFPSNDFGSQELATNEEIRLFCQENYQVSFPLFARSSVRGEEQSELFRFLTAQSGPIAWNFEKFFLDERGRVIRRYKSSISPRSEEVVSFIESRLGASQKQNSPKFTKQ